MQASPERSYNATEHSFILSPEGTGCANSSADPGPSHWCGWSHDKILCWPPTPPDTVAILSCFSKLFGVYYDTSQNVSRYCDKNGEWASYSDYNRCKELPVHISSELDEKTSFIEITATIYLVGFTISLVALMIAVTIFLSFKELRCLRNLIHINLFISYILSAASWIMNYALQMHANMGLCTTMIISLHYFQVTNFFWMFVEGLYLYVLVVQTFSRDNLKILSYISIGWGAPAVIIVVWSIAQTFMVLESQNNSTVISVKPLGDPRVDESDLASQIIYTSNCAWYNHSKTSQWIFVAPTLIVLAVNVFFLINIMMVLIIKLRSAANAETQKHRKAMKALLVLIPLLGVTYVLFIWGPDHHSQTPDEIRSTYGYYEEVRAALLSTQGFTVALLYCFLNGEVRNAIRHRFNTWHDARQIGRRLYKKCNFDEDGTEDKKRRTRSSSCSDMTTMTTVHSSRISSGSVSGKQRQDP